MAQEAGHSVQTYFPVYSPWKYMVAYHVLGKSASNLVSLASCIFKHHEQGYSYSSVRVCFKEVAS